MYQSTTWREKLRRYCAILWPILLTQIGMNLINVFDTMMSGWASPVDLAGVAIGSGLWFPVMVGFNGVLMAIVPIVAQHLGGRANERVAESVTQALYLSMWLAIVIFAVGGLALKPILAMMDLDPGVHDIAKRYLIGLSFGLPPLFASNVLRNAIDAHGMTRISMIITISAVPINFALNDILIFGKFGFPELGGVGAGYATAVTYWLLLLFYMSATFKLETLRPYRLFRVWFRPSRQAVKEQLALGIPMGLSIFFEASIFSGVTLLVGIMFDTYTIAAHQAASNFSALMFMIPLSMAMALTIIVAHEIGARRLDDAEHYARLGVRLALLVYGLCAVFLYVFRAQIARLYSDDPIVVQMTMQFFIFALFYQLSDAAQASLQGVLRGYKDTAVPFVISMIAYWAIGLPIGYTLAKFSELGAFGFWVGFTVGLTCAAIGFFVRLQFVQRSARGASAAVRLSGNKEH
jgi:MATE family multidrug resistance protein